MKKFCLLALMTAVFSFSGPRGSVSTAHANDVPPAEEASTMDAPSLFDVLSYDARLHVYEQESIEEPGVGPLYVTPEELARTVSAISLKKILKNPQSIVHHQYTNEKNMNLLDPEIVEAQKKAAPRTPARKAKGSGNTKK